MEGLTRLVTESLARHGFDRPLDYRRLHWSRWFRCDSHHSLLFVPSKPGVFALAEEITTQEGADAACPEHSRRVRPAEQSEARPARHDAKGPQFPTLQTPEAGSRKPEAARMLAVTQFFEDDDMAFVLDRMLSRRNVMSSRLTSGRYFVRFVVVEDQTQRRSICAALNQWLVTSAEKATGIGPHFASSLELTPATEYVPQASDTQTSLFEADAKEAGMIDAHVATAASAVPRSEASAPGTNLVSSAPALSMTAPQLDSGAATNIHCPTPLPSGF